MARWSRLLIVGAIALSAPVRAEVGGKVGGTWRIAGEISGRAFTVDCRLEPRGSLLGGECVTLATGDKKVEAGKVYRLTSGSVSGNQVQWAYPTRVLFMSVDIGYAGTTNGDRMSGTISAAGRKGSFTGVRRPD